MKKLLKEKFIFEHELYEVKQGRDQMEIPAFLLEKCVVYIRVCLKNHSDMF